MNQLIREDNALLGKSYAMTYDTAGNILSKNTYSYTLNELCCPIDTDEYTYATTGWKDKLTYFNGQRIIYDELGNPTTYREHNLVWNHVRQLEYYDNIKFVYDSDGNRHKKNNIWYTYDGGKLHREVRDDCTLTFFYDTTGICGFMRRRFIPDEYGNPTFDDEHYYYVKNLQGDVTAIYSECGTLAAEYKYDAWGKCTITYDPWGIAYLNPIRYRGYYYDNETGLYYLKSRYYDPNTGRFINADMYVSTGQGILGNNMFAYCQNNPVIGIDPSGKCCVAIAAIISVLRYVTKLIIELLGEKNTNKYIRCRGCFYCRL